jgi:hypothetical protein
MRDRVIETLFSLFTSSDRAEALAGDLVEERERRGWGWFWLHAMRTTVALWQIAAVDAPLQVVALVLGGCALFIVPAVAGAAAVDLFPRSIGSASSWIALSFFWFGGALWTGASLVALAPRRGMAACAALAVVAEALLIVFGVTSMPAGSWSAELLLFYTTGLLAGAPLLAGGALARRRTIAGASSSVGQRR